MKKAICPKCNKLISVDENGGMVECQHCHQQIIIVDAIKLYNRTISVYKRKAEVAFLGSTEYKKAFENYSKLLLLVETSLTVLTSTSLSRLYCSTLHEIYIKEATDILLKGSDKVEINKDNAKLLSEFLKKFKEDSLKIISSLSKYKSEDKYAYNNYLKAVNEYIYFLNKYLEIYNSLDKVNGYFVENSDVINDALAAAKKLLLEKFETKNNNEAKHDFFDDKHKRVIGIFPNHKKIYMIRMGLYGSMGIGFICAIVGLIMLTTNKESQTIPGIVAGVGLVIFIGSYFISNYLRRKIYGTKY